MLAAADRIGIDAAEILNSVGEVAYDWRIDTDALRWGANAAAVLLESMGGKGWSVDELVAILNDPGTKYTTKPENVLKYATFMNEIGTLKNKPALIPDLFFDTPEIAGGN